MYIVYVRYWEKCNGVLTWKAIDKKYFNTHNQWTEYYHKKWDTEWLMWKISHFRHCYLVHICGFGIVWKTENTKVNEKMTLYPIRYIWIVCRMLPNLKNMSYEEGKVNFSYTRIKFSTFTWQNSNVWKWAIS